MTRQKTSLLDKQNITEIVLKIVRSSEIPVSIDWVSRNSRLNWSTTRALLLQLALDGRIAAVRTMKGWIFEALPPLKASVVNKEGTGS